MCPPPADWPLELDAPLQTFDGPDAQSGPQDQVGMDEFIAKETSAARRGALPNSSAYLNPLEPKFHGIFGKDCPIFRLHGSVPHKVPYIQFFFPVNIFGMWFLKFKFDDRFARLYIKTFAPLRKASCSALTWQPAAWTYRKSTGFYSTTRPARPRTMCIESVERRASASKELRYSSCCLPRLHTWPYWRRMG
jgi:hypothetical protein